MKVDKKYKYDIAFSFVQQDEEIAIKLNDLLQGRFNTFIYSKKQTELVGNDGEEVFNKVFNEQSRIVVVLYRNEWGKTNWTRIEMTAIKNRAFEDGYGFAIFIVLDRKSSLPKWIPKTEIWQNFDRWGIEGAISAIEFKVQQKGGIEKVESITDKAARIDRELDFLKKKESFLESAEGVQAANREFAILFEEIERIVKDISDNNQHFNIGFDRDRGGRQVTLLYHAYSLIVSWSGNVINSLSTSYLYIGLWKRLSRFDPYEKSDKVFEHKVKFDMFESNKYGWCLEKDERKYSSKLLAELIVNIILEKVK